MTSVRQLFGALVCLASAAVPCAQAASSSASITNLKFQVIDLTPDDNFTAGYRLVDHGSMSSTARARVQGLQGAPSEDFESALGYLAPVSASATAPGSSGQSRVDATGLYSQAATTEMSRVATLANWEGLDIGAHPPAIVIAPLTELIITVHYVAMGSIDHLGCDSMCVHVTAGAVLLFDVFPRSFSQGIFLSSDRFLMGDRTDLTQTVEGDFTYTVSNPSRSSSSTTLILQTGANIRFQPPAVPEPSEMVLMLLGMGIVGAMVRIRRRSALH